MWKSRDKLVRIGELLNFWVGEFWKLRCAMSFLACRESGEIMKCWVGEHGIWMLKGCGRSHRACRSAGEIENCWSGDFLKITWCVVISSVKRSETYRERGGGAFRNLDFVRIACHAEPAWRQSGQRSICGKHLSKKGILCYISFHSEWQAPQLK